MQYNFKIKSSFLWFFMMPYFFLFYLEYCKYNSHFWIFTHQTSLLVKKKIEIDVLFFSPLLGFNCLSSFGFFFLVIKRFNSH